MTSTHTRLFRSSLIAVSLVLLGNAPSFGRNMPVPCSAFARNTNGGWKVLAPVMLSIGGKPLGPMVGSTLPAGSMPNGVKVSEVLDRECGNGAIWPVAHQR